MMSRITRLLHALWRSISAVIAVGLIITAFVLGWMVRGPTGETGSGPPTTAPGNGAATAPATMYTCSMHPDVRLPDPESKCPICFMDLIPVAGSDLEAGDDALQMSAAAMKLAEIRTTPVVRMFPTRTVRTFGRID